MLTISNDQRAWRPQDRASAWRYLFATIEEVRIYMGMEENEEARALTAKLDGALLGLPPKKAKTSKKKGPQAPTRPALSVGKTGGWVLRKKNGS